MATSPSPLSASTPASDGPPPPGERSGGATQPPPPSGDKTKRPTQSEVSTKDKAPPKQAPSGAAASPHEANPTGGPLGAGTQGASPKGAPPSALTASRSLTDRLACKEEDVFALPPVQPHVLGSAPAPAPAPAFFASSPAAPNAGLSIGFTNQPAPAATGGGVATGVPRSLPAPAKITGPYPSTTRDAMAPGPYAPSSRRGLGGGVAPFRDANQALGLTARPLPALAAPSPVQQAASSQASPAVQAAPSPGQSVTLTLPPTWGPGKQLRLRFGDGACTLAA